MCIKLRSNGSLTTDNSQLNSTLKLKPLTPKIFLVISTKKKELPQNLTYGFF